MEEAGFSPGQCCSDYRIVRLLGSGGYADVYKAVHTVTNETVALKCLKPKHINNTRAKERLLAEARLFTGLRHANVVRVNRVGSDQGAIWMAMEFLDGGTLRDVMNAAAGPMPIVKALYYGREIADGVAALHEMRVVHRDLKPENIMATPEGRVKVLDAGAGKFFGWDVQSTGPLAAVGTPLYMAPEHILGEPVDGRTDIYALGLILYEMFAGHHPFARDPSHQATQVGVIAWQLHSVPPVLSSVMPRFPESVSKLVDRAMAKRPHDRPGTMTEFAQAIRVEWQRCLREGMGEPQALGEPARTLAVAAPGETESAETVKAGARQSNTRVSSDEMETPPLAQPAKSAAAPTSADGTSNDDAMTVEIRPSASRAEAPSRAPETSTDVDLDAPTREIQRAPSPSTHRAPTNGTEPLQGGRFSYAEGSLAAASPRDRNDQANGSAAVLRADQRALGARTEPLDQGSPSVRTQPLVHPSPLRTEGPAPPTYSGRTPSAQATTTSASAWTSATAASATRVTWTPPGLIADTRPSRESLRRRAAVAGLFVFAGAAILLIGLFFSLRRGSESAGVEDKKPSSLVSGAGSVTTGAPSGVPTVIAEPSTSVVLAPTSAPVVPASPAAAPGPPATRTQAAPERKGSSPPAEQAASEGKRASSPSTGGARPAGKVARPGSAAKPNSGPAFVIE